MKAIGKRPEEVQGSPMMYVVTVVASLITMVVLAAIVNAFGSTGIVAGALLGAVIWIGVGGASGYTGTLFEARPMAIWRINSLYNLAVFVIMGAVFAAW
jgi:hypothetical protein